MFVGLKCHRDGTINPKDWTVGAVHKNIESTLISWDQPMSYEDWVKDWVKRPPRPESAKDRKRSIRNLFLCYTFVWIYFLLIIPVWSEGYVNGFQFKVLAVVLYISLYFQGVWPSGTFPKWDRFAMIVTFPLASVVYVIRQSFVLVGMIITSLAAGAAGLLIVAVVIFITVGLFGILLFGVRQVF
jgi:hypothetical protein